MSKKEKMLLLGLAVVGVLVLGYFFLYSPMVAETVNITAKVETLKKEVSDVEKSGPELDQKIAKAEENILKYAVDYYGDVDQEEFIEKTNKLFTDNKLSISKISHVEAKDQKSASDTKIVIPEAMKSNAFTLSFNVDDYNKMMNLLESMNLMKNGKKIVRNEMSLKYDAKGGLECEMKIAFVKLPTYDDLIVREESKLEKNLVPKSGTKNPFTS